VFADLDAAVLNDGNAGPLNDGNAGPLNDGNATVLNDGNSAPHDAGSPSGCADLDVGSTLGPGVWAGNLSGAGATRGSCGGTGSEVTLRFVAPTGGTYVIDTSGSAVDTVLYVRDGACDGPELACDDDVSRPLTSSELSVTLTAAQVVFIVVDVYDASSSGNATLNINGPSTGCVRMPEVCNGLDEDCDGIVDEDASKTCASGANVERSPCVSGACVFECAPQYSDCDGDHTNGCETSLRRNDAHCGGCDVRCGAGTGCSFTASCVRLPMFESTFSAAGLVLNDVVGTPDGALVVGSFAGAIDVAGTRLTARGGTDLVILSIDALGALRWARTFGDVGDERGTAITIDVAGNVYVTGDCYGTCAVGGASFVSATRDFAAFAASFTSVGAPRWSTGVVDAGSIISPSDIVVAPSGRTQVAFNYTAPGFSLFTRADVATFDAAGVLLRRQNFNANFRTITALAYDGSDLWVGGTFIGYLLTGGRIARDPSRGGQDVVIMRVDSTGLTTIYTGGSVADDELAGMQIVGGEAVVLANLAGDAPFFSSIFDYFPRVTLVRFRASFTDRAWTIDWPDDALRHALASDGTDLFVLRGEVGMLNGDGTGYQHVWPSTSGTGTASALATGATNRLFKLENDTLTVFRYR